MSSGGHGGRGPRGWTTHPAGAAQRKEMPPHPATVAQRKEMPPHPATVAQRKGLPPHPATVAHRNGLPPHAAAAAQPKALRAPGLTIQCDGIGFKPHSKRRETVEIAIKDLTEQQLDYIDKHPDAPDVVYFPEEKKAELRLQVSDRIDEIKAAKLKKVTDGGLGYHHGTGRYVVTHYPRPDTPTREELNKAYSKNKFEVVAPRTPVDYDVYPPEVVHSPGGSLAYRSGAYGSESPGGHFHGVAIWTSNFPDRLPTWTPSTPRSISDFPIPCGMTTKDSGWQSIDTKRLMRWAGERKGYKPTKSAVDGERGDQNSAMGNISAAEAAAHSGYVEGSWEWLHLLAFTLGGIDEVRINHPDNLVAGTLGANRVHKVIEDTIKKLIGDKITHGIEVRATAHVKKGSYHLCEKLEYGLRFRRGMIGELQNYHFYIDPLDPNPAQGGNMDILIDTLSTLPGIGGSSTFFK